MATETVINRPAPFVEDIGKKLSEQALGLQNVPVVTTGITGISRQPGETAAGFQARQDAARAFTTRQQNLAGIAPQVAGQTTLQQTAQTLGAQAAGIDPTTGQKTGLASFEPFLQTAQAQAGAAQGILGQAAGELTGAGTTLGGVPLGAQAFQQDVGQFMSPFQSQVIDATLSEFDRNQAIREQSIRDQQAALGALGSGRAGVQLAEFGTGAARERALLQANLLQQGFQQAQAARQQDIANRFGLGQAQAGLAGQQAGFAGQRAGLAGAQLGQAQFQTGLASLVPGLIRADVGQLGTLGALNQAQAQAQADAQREAARQAAFLPQEQLDRYAAQVTGIMGGYPGQTQTTNIPNPTPLQTALGVGTTLAGIYGAYKNPTTSDFGNVFRR